ncbi:fusarubin cluster-transcription factor [Pyrenophora seminiperda CCB06]|uniref:Fusarubin cluster-transcription factor n=1 Tax=Pyrenophora seminiperda CCB06 TaxID=1302712 RepID=A0A3M7LZM3_9PLEO|nr:fusarubin cluster-transcription factor [Pyrenophora seminiperda CCB06]
MQSSNQLQASSQACHGNCFSPSNSFSYFVGLPTPGSNAVPLPPSSSGGCDDLDGFLFGDPKDSMELLGSYEDQNSNHQFNSFWSPLGETPTVALTALPDAGAPCNHDCEARATEIIHSLHYHPEHFTDLSPAFTIPNEAGAARDVAMPSIDKIILLNRKALVNLPELLECTCARYPHLALLHVAILCKVLFLYRVVICAHDTRSSAPGSENRSTPSSGSGSSNSSSMNQMPPVKIQIGELQLDTDDRAILQSAILLRELRKMENTIGQLTVLDTNWADKEADTTRELSATYWYGLSMPKIREELDTLIKMAINNHDQMFDKIP